MKFSSGTLYQNCAARGVYMPKHSAHKLQLPYKLKFGAIQKDEFIPFLMLRGVCQLLATSSSGPSQIVGYWLFSSRHVLRSHLLGA